MFVAYCQILHGCKIYSSTLISGVTESNFPSILRRSLVWRPKGKFWDPSFLQKHYKDAHLDGIFPQDPDLKQFLVSGPCVAAGLSLQHGFESENNEAACRQTIEDYAQLGGDGGLTEDRMRFACGLKAKDRKTASAADVAAQLGAQASQDDDDDEAAL